MCLGLQTGSTSNNYNSTKHDKVSVVNFCVSFSVYYSGTHTFGIKMATEYLELSSLAKFTVQTLKQIYRSALFEQICTDKDLKITFDDMVSKLLSELVKLSSGMTIKVLQIWGDFKVKVKIEVGCQILACIHHHAIT